MSGRIQTIAFVIFTLMFVAIMAILNNTILTMGTSANSQLSSLVTSNDAALNIYDNQVVYGSTVVNCAKDPSSISETIDTVYVLTAGGDCKEYKEPNLYTGATGNNAINSSAKFNSYLCVNNNGVVTAVLFTQSNTDKDNVAAAVETIKGSDLTVSGYETASE